MTEDHMRCFEKREKGLTEEVELIYLIANAYEVSGQ